MNENNESFLRDFEYYKKNPKKFKLMNSNVGLGFVLVFVVIYTILWAFFGDTKIANNNHYALTLLFFLVTVLALGVSLYTESYNKRFKTFSKMIYTDNPADLFGDLSNPDLKYYLNDIVKDLNNYSGVHGFTAFKIYSKVQADLLRKQSLEQSKAHESIQEIKDIQKQQHH